MANANNDRSWISRIRLGAIASIIALGVLFIPTLIAGRPGQAPQTGPTYKVLYAFTGGADGSDPYAGVIPDPTRRLIVGTTGDGGSYGYGTVFGVSPTTGKETVLYSFTGGADGAIPLDLIRDLVGNLYGTTAEGGAYNAGVVFELSPAGQETVLYTFTGGADGGYPSAGLIRDASGNLYGTTYFGGAYDEGVAFELSPSGQETVLYTFTGGADGAWPSGTLIRDSAGNLYGTTVGRGNPGGCGGTGCGVVFELSPTGQETVLYTFTGGADGGLPRAGLIRDRAGNLYGTTQEGGNLGDCSVGYGCGAVFELSPTGQETVLYSFTGADGAAPDAGLIRDASGNLYGTTNDGGAYGYGVAFKLSPTGQETVLYSFTGSTDGGGPRAGLIRDRAGNLYGTTLTGGDMNSCSGYGCGVVFKLTP